MQARPPLTIEQLQSEAAIFAGQQSLVSEPVLYGVTDGKAIGTYIELRFNTWLMSRYGYTAGNAAQGIDFPELNVDLKVTSIRQPQSSSPYRSARQKIYGLGYSLLIFVYEKQDDLALQAATLKIRHVIFVHAERTADFQITRKIREILAANGNEDDILACIYDHHLPVDDATATLLVEEIMRNPPVQGLLTISNALQWRLQYKRVIQ